MQNAKLLTEPANFAVVQLPNRAFPGVVIQGDSLHNMVSNLKFAIANCGVNEDQEVRYALITIEEQLSEALAQYVQVCTSNSIALPFAS